MIQYSWGSYGLVTKDVSSYNAQFHEPLWANMPPYDAKLLLVEGRGLPSTTAPPKATVDFLIARVSRFGRASILLGTCKTKGGVPTETAWRTFDDPFGAIDFLLYLGIPGSALRALRQRLLGEAPASVLSSWQNPFQTPEPEPVSEPEPPTPSPPIRSPKKKLAPLDYSQLDPGIRRIVQILREAGFNTTDSGDGATKLDTQPDALDYPHVFCRTSNSLSGREAGRLYRTLGPRLKPESRPNLEVSVAIGSPYIGDRKLQGTAIMCVLGVSDADLE